MGNALTGVTYITFGADPELFFSDAQGQIVGSDKVLGDRLLAPDYAQVTKDGVQAEFILTVAHTCRQSMGHGFRGCFRALQPLLNKASLKVDLRPVVEVSADHLATLSDKARILGCAPSFNIYDRPSELLEAIDPVTYRKRSAGGHLHFSGEPGFKDPKRAVPLFDLLIGIPSVMLDRDPAMAERRQLYGRAGEYRTPKATKGSGADIEYRTLSNFWLRSFQLMHLVTGLGRYCADVLYNQREREILALVDRDAVIEAINTNDFDAARKIWFAIKPKLAGWSPFGGKSSRTPIWAEMLPKFDALCDKGIDEFWPVSTAAARWSTQHTDKDWDAAEFWGFERWIDNRPMPLVVVAVSAPSGPPISVAEARQAMANDPALNIVPPTVTQEGDPNRWNTTVEKLTPNGDAAGADIVAAKLDIKKARRLPQRDAYGKFVSARLSV